MSSVILSNAKDPFPLVMLNAVKHPFLLVIKGFFLFAELRVRMTKVIRHPVLRGCTPSYGAPKENTP